MDRDDVRVELENVLSGSMWVPRASGAGPLAPRQAVEVTLVLPDGRIVEGVRGRVFCEARVGVAVFVEDLPVDVLTLLTEECNRDDMPVDHAPESMADATPLAVVSHDDIAPEDAPMFEPPVDLLEPSALPTGKGQHAEESTPPSTPSRAPVSQGIEPPLTLARAVLEGEERPVVRVTPAEVPSAVAVAPETASASAEFPAEKIEESELSAAWGNFAAATPTVAEPVPAPQPEPPPAPQPEPDAVFASSPVLAEPVAAPVVAPAEPPVEVPVAAHAPEPVAEPIPEPVDESPIDFPALRPADVDPVPSIAGDAGVWGESDLGLVDLPAEKQARPEPVAEPVSEPVPEPVPEPVAESAPEPVAEAVPASPAEAAVVSAPVVAVPATGKPAATRVTLVMPFATLREFQKEYETNIRRGGVLVPTATPPPIRSAVQVVFSMMNGKREVRLDGEAVFHAPTGVGVQLSGIPPAVRSEIEGLLAAASSTTTDAHSATTTSSRPPAAASPAIAPATPRATSPSSASGSAFEGEPLAMNAPPGPRGANATYAEILDAPPAGDVFEGDLVELLREAEVEGEARVDGQIGGRASWLKVLATLQAQKATGILTASRKSETKNFFVHQGRIVDATGREDESLPRITKKLGLLKPGAQKVLEKAAAEHEDDEDAAIQAAGVWSAAEADRARRWVVLERAADVFEWERGKYRFDPRGDRAWARPTTGVPVGHVILQGLRSNVRASGEDLARIMRTTLDRAVRIVPGTGFEPKRVGMSDKELRFWSDFDGIRTVRQLLAITPLPISQTYRILFALLRLGVCELEKPKSTAAPTRVERADVLRERLADLKGRDPFARLGISWMAAQQQVDAGWQTLRRELEVDLKAGGEVTEVARQVLALCEESFRALNDPRTRRTARMKLIDDPSRIESSAEMLGEKAELLAMRGDKPGALSAIQMALELLPGDPKLQSIGSRILR